MHTTLFWCFNLLVWVVAVACIIVVLVVNSTICTREESGKTIVEEDNEDVDTPSVGLICAIRVSSVLRFSVLQHKYRK